MTPLASRGLSSSWANKCTRTTQEHKYTQAKNDPVSFSISVPTEVNHSSEHRHPAGSFPARWTCPASFLQHKFKNKKKSHTTVISTNIKQEKLILDGTNSMPVLQLHTVSSWMRSSDLVPHYSFRIKFSCTVVHFPETKTRCSWINVHMLWTNEVC